MKKYDDFDTMMNELGCLTFNEANDLSLTQGLVSIPKEEAENESSVFQLENHGGYAAIFSCKKTNEMVKEISNKFNLQIITYSVGESFSYSTGMHFVNREMYLFCRSTEEGWCEESQN